MIKFEEKVEPPKKVKKQDENRFDKINEAALEKRKKTETADLKSCNSTHKNKED